ncbi:MAG TPA: sugar transferase [Candidatus Akkermansia intestinavium]|nr:sugar transferase [Candidatus Akkermansia intestinavium]
MYRRLIKPLCDRIAALLLLILLSPILIATGLLLAVANRGHIFFTQPRPGKNEKIFQVIKFKTMNDRRDAKGELLPDAERLTPIGKFVRSTSIDELPQLINVLKGDMSFIGPRPLLVQYLPLYNETQRRRHLVTPGISGWAQVNGRNAISWARKFDLDVWYVDHISFLLDCKIVWMTICNILRRKDINQQGQATMEAFNGKN